MGRGTPLREDQLQRDVDLMSRYVFSSDQNLTGGSSDVGDDGPQPAERSETSPVAESPTSRALQEVLDDQDHLGQDPPDLQGQGQQVEVQQVQRLVQKKEGDEHQRGQQKEEGDDRLFLRGGEEEAKTARPRYEIELLLGRDISFCL